MSVMSPVSPFDVLRVFFSPSFQTEETDKVQVPYLIPFTVAEHPQIVNEETLLADIPSWYQSKDMERDPSEAIEPPRMPNKEVKRDANMRTAAPEKETMKTPKTTNSNRSLQLKKTTEAEEFSSMRNDTNPSLEFLRKWRALNGEPPKQNPPREASLSPMLANKWKALNNESEEENPPKVLNGELEEENPQLEDPASPIFDRQCKALNGEPDKEKPSRKTPFSTIMEPEITKTGKNEKRKAHTIKWLQTSNSFLAVSSLCSTESREDDSCNYDVGGTRIFEQN